MRKKYCRKYEAEKAKEGKNYTQALREVKFAHSKKK